MITKCELCPKPCNSLYNEDAECLLPPNAEEWLKLKNDLKKELKHQPANETEGVVGFNMP